MKKCFFTGLGILLPIVLTALIISFLINLLTKPFLGIAQTVLEHYGLLGKSFFFLKTDQIVLITSKLIVLGILAIITLLIGMIAKWVVVHYFIRTGDYVIHKIPVVNKIYKAIKEVVSTLFDSTEQNFSQVVLVHFPHSQGLALGMVVKERLPEGSDAEHADLISVFVPATPNPTMGFMLLYKRENVNFIDMKVEDALKCIVSCGVMFAEKTDNTLS
jgi:uncharacterized membrane protein